MSCIPSGVRADGCATGDTVIPPFDAAEARAIGLMGVVSWSLKRIAEVDYGREDRTLWQCE